MLPPSPQIRKNSKLLYGKRTVLTNGRRKSIPPASNCDSFQSYGSTPTLASSERDAKTIEDEIKVLRQLLTSRDEEISKLKREIDKLKVGNYSSYRALVNRWDVLPSE